MTYLRRCARMNSYTVTVVATDPKGIPTEDACSCRQPPTELSATPWVTITVMPVNEPPIFTVTGDGSSGIQQCR